jgi:GrpB-like predicted nucleotidyltransferase (UPF0157 family)/GNAT superfamily N-acetyltransferase
MKTGLTTDPIKVVAYNHTWPSAFGAEAFKIRKVLGANCTAIHHVGSTSVPDLAAKPKIDIIAVVQDLLFDKSQLESIGYKYRGGFNIPLRRSFTIRAQERNINLHVFEENDPEIELNILFRDYLCANPDARDEYAQLKYNLIKQESSHKLKNSMYRGYTLGKHEFIQNILKKAGFNKHRFVLCTHVNEWEAVKYFRETYFFSPKGFQDPYTWTFESTEHKHLVLYQGIDIAGYVHIHFLKDKASIPIIVVHQDRRNQGVGSKLLALSEKWLKKLGVKSIHAQVNESNMRFYITNDYTEMPFDAQLLHHSHPNSLAIGKLL